MKVPSCDFRVMSLKVRALDCPPRALVALRRLLGVEGPSDGAADVCLRFVDRISWSSQRKFAGPDAAWDGRNFCVRQPGGWLQVPILDLENPPYDLVCEQDVSNLPILRPLLQMHAVLKGTLPVHGSAFTFGGHGFIVTGWPGAAKTGMALAAIDGGGMAIAAELSAVDPISMSLFDATEPFRARAWHVRQFANNRLAVRAPSRARLLTTDALLRVVSRYGLHRGPLARPWAAAGQRNWVEMWPRQVPYAAQPSSLRAVICVVGTAEISMSVRASSAEAERRLLLLFDEELAPFSRVYRRYQFLASNGRASLIDDARNRYQGLLRAVLQRVPCHEVLHPESPPFVELLQAITSIADAIHSTDASVLSATDS